MPNLLFMNLGDVVVQHPVAKVNQQVSKARGSANVPAESNPLDQEFAAI